MHLHRRRIVHLSVKRRTTKCNKTERRSAKDKTELNFKFDQDNEEEEVQKMMTHQLSQSNALELSVTILSESG